MKEQRMVGPKNEILDENDGLIPAATHVTFWHDKKYFARVLYIEVSFGYYLLIGSTCHACTPFIDNAVQTSLYEHIEVTVLLA